MTTVSTLPCYPGAEDPSGSAPVNSGGGGLLDARVDELDRGEGTHAVEHVGERLRRGDQHDPDATRRTIAEGVDDGGACGTVGELEVAQVEGERALGGRE